MATVKAIMLPADSRQDAYVLEVDPEDFQALQDELGGYLEFVRTHFWLDDKIRLIVDEEGLLKKKPFNFRAATFYSGPGIVGDALLVGWSDDWDADTNIIDIPQEWIDKVQAAEVSVEEI